LRCGDFKFIEVPRYASQHNKYRPGDLDYEMNRILKENSEKEYYGTLSIKDRVF
jgi:hypothetical protein